MIHSFELFSKSYLFKELKDADLQKIFAISKEVRLDAGETLIREGDQAKELYILIEGNLRITKLDPENHDRQLIDEVFPGDTIGELSFLDRKQRAVTVDAIRPCTLRSIAFEDLYRIINQNKGFGTLFFRFAENIASKLRRADDVLLEALRHKMQEYELRTRMGDLLITLVAVLSALTFTLPGLKHLMEVLESSTYITLPLTAGIGIFFLIIVRSFKLTLSQLGVTTQNLKRSLYEGFFYTLVFLFLGGLLKWYLMVFPFRDLHRPFFEPFSMFPDPEYQTLYYWIITNMVYWVVIVPLQEILTRGGLQGILEQFLTGKHRVLMSIVISNLIFSSAHVFFSVYLALTVFIAGLFLGWLYSRTHNLAGCCLSHAMMGTVGFSILGMAGYLF